MRELVHTDEFNEFYEGLTQRAKDKFDYCLNILEILPVINAKVVKRNATKVILLNGFVKKSTNDYGKEIKKAERILNNIDL